MRFIHTADWHLGNSMHDINRVEEMKEYLSWLKTVINEKEVETLIVSGDIFDVANPSNETKSIYYRFLASLLDTCCKNVIITGGNHDSAALLDAPKDLLEALNISVIGSISGKELSSLVIELKNSAGEVNALCAAIPFTREADIRDYVTDKDAVFADNANKGLYQAVYNEAEIIRNGRDIPIIAMGHLYAAGLEGRPENDDGEGLKESGVRNIVGNLGTVSVSVFPSGFDYVALGHIHYTTMVSKNPKVRYSGSPFVLGFDEAAIPHYILVVDTKRDKEPEVEFVKTPKYFRFYRVLGSIDDIKTQLKELRVKAAEYPENRIKVEIVYDYVVGVNIREELKADIMNAPFEIVNWKTSRSHLVAASDLADDTLDDVKTLGEEEVFRRLIIKNIGLDKSEEEIKTVFDDYWPMFKLLMDEVEESDMED